MSSNSYHFFLIGTLDNPLYTLSFSSSRVSSLPPSSNQGSTSAAAFSIFGAVAVPAHVPGTSSVGYPSSKTAPGASHVAELVAHASLDCIEDAMWTQNGMYLKAVDKFHEWTVSAWLTPGGMKLVLLHENKADDAIRLFFQEAWEAYVKCLLNPFHYVNKPITSRTFDARIRGSAKKNL
ncbi:Sedlin [Atractiella rhizophila]|nr:Sedlin [Atractiella rhizophila]